MSWSHGKQAGGSGWGQQEPQLWAEAAGGPQGASLPSRGRGRVPPEPGQEPVPASTRDLAAQEGSSRKPSASGVRGRGPRGGSATIARKEGGGPSVWPSQPSQGSRAWTRGCRQGGHPQGEGWGCECGSGDSRVWHLPAALGGRRRGGAYGASRVVGGVSCTAGIRKLPSGAAQVPLSLSDLGQLLV